MFLTSKRPLVVLAFLLHNILVFSQNPDCPKPTFFKNLGAASHSEFGTVLAQSSDGNLYLAGRDGNKTFLQKTTLAGDAIWLREFQISPFEPITPSEIIEDSDGMIVGCGTQSQFAGARRGFVFRYDPAADTLIWAHPVSSNNPAAAGILEKEAGGSFVYYQNPVLSNGETDMEILDLDRSSGNIIPAFANRYEYISYDALSKIVNVGGSLYGLGWAAGRFGTTTDARRLLLARFDPVNGMPLWAQLSHADTTEAADFYGRDLVADGDNLIAAYAGNGDSIDPGVYHLFLQKTDLDGNILWVRRYDFAAGILKLLTVPDGYVVYGQQNGNEYLVLKTDKNGVPVWTRRLTNGPTSMLNTDNLAPNLALAAADSLYFTGIATTGLTDVFFWKILADGAMADSCGYVDNLVTQSYEVQNPVRTVINLQQLISTAVTANSTMPWAVTTFEEQMLCPDCSVPDPCPEGNDFVVEINSISCNLGFVNMSFGICDLDGGALPDLSVTFYNANPYTEAADKLGIYDFSSSDSDSCATVQLNNLQNLFGANAVQNGFQIFAVVNDPGTTNTPIAPGDFPLSDLEECNYANNLDSFMVQLPVAPTLNLGADQTICSNQVAMIDAGAGFFKYQWSNGAITPSISVSFAGQYRVTVTDACGFKQSDTVNLQVRQLPLVSASGSFCPGKSVTVRGFNFDQVGTFQKTIAGVNGDCDTSVTFFITELPYEERVQIVTFCPFHTVTINGVTYEDSGLALDTVSAAVGCDTVIYYFLNQLPLPFRYLHYDICPGDAVTFNGQVYTAPIDFTDTLYSAGAGCDTIVYFSIAYQSLVELEQTIQFCPGTSVVIGGQSYTQPGMVTATLPSSGGGCDTLVNYTLEWLPAPTRNETLEFCQGESITLGGQTYTQPTTVTLTVSGNGSNCDTLVTYTLQYSTPGPSSMSLACPAVINVATVPGTGPIPVNYNAPVASSNCECPGENLALSAGLASGSSFPVGTTQVCYTAQDKCGSTATCCFTVTVREEQPCDTKTVGCMKYELLGITTDAQQRYTYRIQVTNSCSNKLIYTAIQLPDGINAVNPINLSTYTSPDGRDYAVRNPNFTPFHSIRFKSTNDSIANGESDIFEYTLPAQSHPTFIHITSRLATQSFYEAHLNTFNCPVGTTMSQNRSEAENLDLPDLSNLQGLLLFPNPTSAALYADLTRWQGKSLKVKVLDSRGQRAQSLSLMAESEPQSIPLASQLPAGLYFLEIVTENREREVARFVLER